MSEKAALWIGGLVLSAVLFGAFWMFFMVRIEPGYVGIRVHLAGTDRGISTEVLEVGRYVEGINQEIKILPTSQLYAIWTKDATEGSRNDDSFTFNTKDGSSINVDVSVEYSIVPETANELILDYPQGVSQITHVAVKNAIRNALSILGSTMDIEYAYGEGKAEFTEKLNTVVKAQMADKGININTVAFIGGFRLPANIVTGINEKLAATQRAQQRENELRESEAEAKKSQALAEGAEKVKIIQATAEANATKIRSEAEAAAILVKATAQAKANKLLSESLTPLLVQNTIAETWDGFLPKVTGGSVPFINIDNYLEN